MSKEPLFVPRGEQFAVIDGKDSIRILLKDPKVARLLAHRLQTAGYGYLPYRVASVTVFETPEPKPNPPTMKGRR